jgi:integrase
MVSDWLADGLDGRSEETVNLNRNVLLARLAGHSSSRTTEVIYRRELRPVLVKGAEVMDHLFG